MIERDLSSNETGFSTWQVSKVALEKHRAGIGEKQVGNERFLSLMLFGFCFSFFSNKERTHGMVIIF